MTALRNSKTLRDAIHMWLWWATFEATRASGSTTTSAYKAAQKATARLYA